MSGVDAAAFIEKSRLDAAGRSKAEFKNCKDSRGSPEEAAGEGVVLETAGSPTWNEVDRLLVSRFSQIFSCLFHAQQLVFYRFK